MTTDIKATDFMTTGRLILRAVEPADADFMYEVDNDASAWTYSDTIAPLSRKMLRDYALGYDADPFRSGQLRLIVAEKDSHKPVGILDLYEISPLHRRAFAGIYICAECRRSGYALEALSAAREYARGMLAISKLWAKIPEGNVPSVNLFQKAGYEVEATLADWFSSAATSGNLLILSLDCRKNPALCLDPAAQL